MNDKQRIKQLEDENAQLREALEAARYAIKELTDALEMTMGRGSAD